jgi:hypothetical protein
MMKGSIDKLHSTVVDLMQWKDEGLLYFEVLSLQDGLRRRQQKYDGT